MPARQRRALIAVLVVILFIAVLFKLDFFAAKWDSYVDTSSTRGMSNPPGFQHTYTPRGDWLVVLECPDDIRDALASGFSKELSAMSQGEFRADFITELPSGRALGNVLYVKVSEEISWYFFYAKRNSVVEVNVATDGFLSWPSFPMSIGVLETGAMRIRINMDIYETCKGIITPGALVERRASQILEYAIKEIKDAYDAWQMAASES